MGEERPISIQNPRVCRSFNFFYISIERNSTVVVQLTNNIPIFFSITKSIFIRRRRYFGIFLVNSCSRILSRRNFYSVSCTFFYQIYVYLQNEEILLLLLLFQLNSHSRILLKVFELCFLYTYVCL